MKLLVEKRKYSFDQNQEQNKKSLLIIQGNPISKKTKIESIDSVLEQTYSYISKRIEQNSLYYYSSDEQQKQLAFDDENTYINIDEFNSSLTSITSNEQLHVLHQFDEEQNQTIRSSIDNLSLNSSITLSSIHLFDKQQINKTNTDDDDEDDDDDEYDIVIDQLKHFRNNSNVRTPSYDFIQSNSSNQIVSPLFKTNNISDKDGLTTSNRISSPLSFNKRQTIIQMDEKECTLEMIDGVPTLVPKKDEQFDDDDDDDEEEEEQQRQNSIEYEISQNYDSPEHDKHSSSFESSVSTPSISEHEQEHSFSTSHKEQSQEPFILLRDLPSSKSPPLSSTQNEQNVDLLDLFSTPPVPLSTSQTNENPKNLTKNLLDDSLSLLSFEEQNPSHSESVEKEQVPSMPIENQSKHSSPSTSIKDEESLSTSNQLDYPLPKPEPPPVAKPINKARINEFASLLSSAVHLSKPPSTSSLSQSETRHTERESFHTIPTSDSEETTKKHIDARYNEKVDDRKNIQINTTNIKALFEQKISDTVKALTQSTEQLVHVQENKQQYKKPPTSYAYVNKQQTQPIIYRRQSFQDSTNMNKFQETKEIVIEDKQPEQHTHQTQLYSSRRNNTEQMPRSNNLEIANGYYSESLIAREIRETKEKEEELRQQRKKCGLPENVSSLLPPRSTNDLNKSDQSSKPPVKNSSFLSNLDFFTSKSVESNNSSRRSTVSIQNLVYDSSSNDEQVKQSNINPDSVHLAMKRASSNQILASSQTKTNFIQQEIEAIRAKESELRQLGRIQHTSDEHSDPRKYQELVSTMPKSQSIHVLPTGRIKKDTEKFNAPILPSTNGLLKPKTANSSSSISSVRGRFPSPNPTAPIVSSSNRSIDYSKLSSADRLELEKREMQEREIELRKQRHSLSGNISMGNSTVNGDSGNVSQDEHDDERYFDKIQRLKRTENEKAQAPLQRPTKKSNLSQRWEQMVANKNNSNFSDDQN